MTQVPNVIDELEELAADTEPFVHYFDQHPTEEDLMGSSAIQGQLMRYLVSVLEWLYRAEGWFVASDMNIYQRRKRYEGPVSPDVALFTGVVIPQPSLRRLRSWRLYEPNRPPPTVVFEISSDGTWENDLTVKPIRYAEIGVREYFAYDPNDPPYFPKKGGRLRGWRLNDGAMVPLLPDAQGRLWSIELESYLVPDGAYLRLCARDGQRRLTRAEAAIATAEAERAAKEAERAAKEAERAAKEAERAAKEAERAAKEAAWAKLRELGIDPTTL